MSDEQRKDALKVAKWLVTKGRRDEAIAVLAAWAAQGPNDGTGQELMAEALRVNPSAPLARMAFERMEGVPGEHDALDAAIQKFSASEIEALVKQVNRPAFLRAQVGFNNNVKYKEQTYHIQTEDSGLDKPHVITHLFADGGRIIKSHKRGYADQVTSAEVVQHVRALMKGQQVEMAIMLREGRFDEVIAGRALGGMEVLTTPPRVEARRRPAPGAGAEAELLEKPKVVFKVQGDVPAAQPVHAPAIINVYTPPYRLIVERTAGGDPAMYEPGADIAVIGSRGEVSIKKERFCHPEEARLVWKDDRLWLQDLPGGNGIFLRIQHLVELEMGTEFLVGDQLIRLERNPDPYDDGPTAEPTYFYSSPKPATSAFRLTQVFEGGALGTCVLARGNSVQVGSETGDMLFRTDPLVSRQHCILEEQAGVIILTDLESRTGVFVKVKGEQEIMHGDELVAGRTRLRVEFTHRPARPSRANAL
jgi:hypothetical protein